MSLFLLIAIPLFIYLAIGGFAVIPFALYMKGRQVPTPVYNSYGNYSLEYNKHQKVVREFWESVMMFSFAWPLELLGAAGWSVYKGIQMTFRALVNSAAEHQSSIMERKVVAKLEAERDKLLALDLPSQEQLDSLDQLISKTKTKAIAA